MPKLTPRETQVAEALLTRMDGMQIAAQLGLAYGSFKVYSHNVLWKLGYKSRIEMMAAALEKQQ